jgi:hypothetical protein
MKNQTSITIKIPDYVFEVFKQVRKELIELGDLMRIASYKKEREQRFQHTWDVIKRTQESIEEYHKRK